MLAASPLFEYDVAFAAVVAITAKVPGEPLADTWWQNKDGRGYVFAELRAIGAYGLAEILAVFK